MVDHGLFIHPSTDGHLAICTQWASAFLEGALLPWPRLTLRLYLTLVIFIVIVLTNS